jgi:hypothetical protein
MRRAVVAVMVGCTLGGIGWGAGHQHAISGEHLAAAIQSVPSGTAVKTAPAAAPAMKTVEYRGYAIRVPATWPVYSLSEDPDQCVRYDVNAVYLGTPGPNQNCPAHLVGRADTVSIGGPVALGSSSTPIRTGLRAAVGAKRVSTDMPAAVGAKPGSTDTPAAPGTIWQDTQLRELAVAMPGSAPAITGTYGTDPDLIMQVLASLHLLTQGQEGPRPSEVTASAVPRPSPSPSTSLWIPPYWPAPAPTGTPTPSPSASPSPAPSSPAPSSPAPSSPAPSSPAPSSPAPSSPAPSSPAPSSPAPVPAPAGALPGFDTCTAPSLPTMQAWRAKYAVAAIYIGGQEMGCDYGNLSKSWVQAAEGMGWSLMPTFVGPQAPCNSFSDEIKSSQAGAEGQQAASQAVTDAASFGLGPGSPIYYDMEAYDETNASCVTAVLTFLDAWDRQLQVSGYVSGVYSSAASGMVDLQTTSSIDGHQLAEPQAIWFALWDNVVNLTGSPYLTPAVWPASARSKQYAGPQVVTVGGVSLNVDSDLVDGPVAQG